MDKNTREFIIKELLTLGFIEHQKSKLILEETEESGKSELCVQLKSEDNLCIANVDRKNTQILFFREEKSMNKRVDHMIFEHQADDQWKLHLIEMKSRVGAKKWVDIKGKFRASYLLAQAIAGILELSISETVMYTTFERVELRPLDTMPSARRVRSGISLTRMEDEWNGKNFCLNFGEKISFLHKPLPMTRGQDGLTGVLKE